ncbi:sensor histidine kinase/response regulator Fos-1/TcsA [Tricladium varicosporioides]|nr:sensor histidine kinase/response regulator Fos-1/TcsA [Hymenoscyphus varicosporioides]
MFGSADVMALVGSDSLVQSAALTPIPTVVLDSRLNICHASESFLTLNNLTHEDCNGIGIYEIISTKGLKPGVVSVMRTIDSALSTKKVHITVDHDAAGIGEWSIRAVPIFKGETLLYLQLEIQEAVEEHEGRQTINDQLDTNDTYRILVQTVKDYAIFMLDTNGNVKTWNAGAALLKGYTREEIVGRHFSSFYGEDDRKDRKPEKELEICMRDGKVEDESWRYRKDGSRFWANVIITSVYRNGVHIGFSKVTRDLTERKASESNLISAYEEAARLKSAFLANMSHEIRTPMHGMLSALSLMMDSPLTPDQQELGSIMEESGAVLLQVINDILDYSKLASGSFSINSHIISIPDIITSVMRGAQTTVKPGIKLEATLDSNLPKSVRGDPLRFRQTVQNLVSNALKFTESGSVQIHAILTSEDDTTYTIRTEIADSGIGIPESSIGSLFTPFTQFDASATKRYKGTGLGLSISKSLAELMGGEIGFYPNLAGHGSVFWFTAKVEKVAEVIETKQTQVNRTDKDSAGAMVVPIVSSPPILDDASREKRLLLVEDNLVNRTVMLKLLKRFGFDNIDTAGDGAEAVQATLDNNPHYDLILMDISMPVMDGIRATIEIRKAGLQVPIIAMTANALKGDVDQYLANGMSDYVSKPVDRRLLMEVLIKWLK